MATVTKNPEQMLSDAIDLLRTAYAAHYRSIGEEIIQKGRDGEFGEGEKAREALMEYMHETIDGDGWVIYTHKAQAVCLVSENDGAYADNFGSEGIVEDGTIHWSRLAFAAMEADIYSYLDAMDFDVNDPDSWKPENDSD